MLILNSSLTDNGALGVPPGGGGGEGDNGETGAPPSSSSSAASTAAVFFSSARMTGAGGAAWLSGASASLFRGSLLARNSARFLGGALAVMTPCPPDALAVRSGLCICCHIIVTCSGLQKGEDGAILKGRNRGISSRLKDLHCHDGS